jgi:hypothetical protein
MAYLTGDLKGEPAIEPETTLELLPFGFCATRGIMRVGLDYVAYILKLLSMLLRVQYFVLDIFVVYGVDESGNAFVYLTTKSGLVHF